MRISEMASTVHEQTVNCCQRLATQLPPEDYITEVWDSFFTNFGEDEVSCDPEFLLELYSCVDDWTRADVWTSPADDVTDFWTILQENDVSCKGLIVYLAALLHRGLKARADSEQLETCILAARTYCRLILVRGSGAFQMFNSVLLEYVFDTIRRLLKTEEADPQTDVSTGRVSNKGKSNKGRKAGKGRGKVCRSKGKRSSISVELDEEETDETEGDRSQSEHNVHHLVRLLMDCVDLLRQLKLGQHKLPACNAVKLLCQLSQRFSSTFDGDFTIDLPSEDIGIAGLAFLGLKYLCLSGDQVQELMLLSTCMELLPSLLMLVGAKPAQTVTKALHVTQEHTLQFLVLLLSEVGEMRSTYLRSMAQNLCVKVTDRAEYRSKVSQAVLTLISQMDPVSYCKFIQWLTKLTHTKDTGPRGFAIEVICELLSQPERMRPDQVESGLYQAASHKALLENIIHSCSDDNPTVRSRAITIFGQSLMSQDEALRGLLQEVVTPQIGQRPAHVPPRLIPTPAISRTIATSMAQSSGAQSEKTATNQSDNLIQNQTESEETGRHQTYLQENQTSNQAGMTMLRTLQITPATNMYLPDKDGVFSMLRRRAKDSRVLVRKAALLALQNAILYEGPNYTPENVEVMKQHCQDPGLSSRKQALLSLTEILTHMPQDMFIQKQWLDGCLALGMDQDTKLAEKLLETVERFILDNIVPHHKSSRPEHQLAWGLMKHVANPDNVNIQRFFQKACITMCKKGAIKPALLTTLQSHVPTQNKTAALMLMAKTIPSLKKVDPSFILDYWHNHQQEMGVQDLCYSQGILKYSTPYLNPADRDALMEDLSVRLLKFESPCTLIAPMIGTISKLFDKRQLKEFCQKAMQLSDKFLTKVIFQSQDGGMAEDETVRHLVTLGEVVMHCPATVPKRIFLLVESMVSAPCITPLPASQMPTELPGTQPPGDLPGTQPSRDLPGTQPSGEPPGTQPPGDLPGAQPSGTMQTTYPAKRRRSDQSNTSSHATESSHHSHGTQSSQPLSQFRDSHMSTRVRATAFLTLGKLCLQHEHLARKYLPAMAHELDTSLSETIRNNVMIIICDLCIRYTTAANMYVPSVYACFKDPSPLVRKQVVTQMTRLLQEEFIKWKEHLFYRFLSTVLDHVEEIREFGEYCLINVLLPRRPELFAQHFVECIFHFNDYRGHKKYNRFKQTDRERRLFSLIGDKEAKKRQELYVFMLKYLTDVQKYKLQKQLCSDILCELLDKLLPLSPDTADLVKDTFFILSSKEIRQSGTFTTNSKEATSEFEQQMDLAMDEVKKNIFTHYRITNILEHVLPAVISLKQLVERARSPLQKDVMIYLSLLLNNHTEEVKEIMRDPQLISEIEYAARRREEQQQVAAQQPETLPLSTQGTPIIGRSPASSLAGSPRTPRVPALNSGAGSPLLSQHITPRPRLKSQSSSPSNSARVGPRVQVAGATANRPSNLLRQAVVQALAQKEDQVGSSPETETQPALRPEGVPQNPSTTSTKATSPSDINKDQLPANTIEGSLVTPLATSRRLRQIKRAISTPSVAMSNITFCGDNNLGGMPSPIPEDVEMKRLIDDSSTSLTPSNERRGKENKLS